MMKNYIYFLLILFISCSDNKTEIIDHTDKSTKLRLKSKQDYIDKYSKIAVHCSDFYEVSPSELLATGAALSNFGTSNLFTRNNNSFNTECFINHEDKNHCERYRDDTHNDKYRTYDSVEQSFIEYSRLWRKLDHNPNKKQAKRVQGIINEFELKKLDTL